jgi:uncharacterized protein YigA (DUF484 family)
MNPDEVAAYLKENPHFFETHAAMISEIYIPHPHGGRAISITERQLLTLRERAKQLEGKLREMIQFGEENDAIGEKVHRFAVALAGAPDAAAVMHTVNFHLREDFAVPHVALRVWRWTGDGQSEFESPSEATREFASSLLQPYCSGHAMVDTGRLFGDGAGELKSFAYVPLRDAECFGLLALASEDAQRFYPGMGTVFLKRIGELVSAALALKL